MHIKLFYNFKLELLFLHLRILGIDACSVVHISQTLLYWYEAYRNME